MSSSLEQLSQRFGLRLSSDLARLCDALPLGADLGTVRVLAEKEIAEPAGALPPALLPIADGGGRDVFALYVPEFPGATAAIVCAANTDTGAYAPIATSVKGFAAWLLLLRQAQSALPGAPGFETNALLQDTLPAAEALAGAFGLEPLLDRALEPHPEAIATALLTIEPAAPWACSTLAQLEPDPMRGFKRLAPALSSAAFSAGLLEQAGDLLLTAGQTARAVRSIFGALQRLEPSLQCAPFRVDDPDPDTGDVYGAFQPAAAFQFLQEHAKDVTREMRDTAPYAFLASILTGPGCSLKIAPQDAIEASRRRGLGGDLPGGRWILHLALGEHFQNPQARRVLAEEAARQWDLAGSPFWAMRLRALASCD